MLKGLPSDFLAELTKLSRKPVQLCVFEVGGKEYYLSDITRTIDGHTYEPWVESWGELVDNSSIEALFGGQSIGFRECDLTLINSPISNVFIQALFYNGVENTPVRLYQWLEGMTSSPVLIDKFVCQDPISVSESSMLVEIALVSELAATDRRLYPVKAGDEHYPIAIGTAKGLPLIDLKTGASATLAQDLKFDQLGWVLFDIHDNMPNSGFAHIDEEQVRYTKRSADKLYLSTRGANSTVKRPHAQGALMTLHDTIFKYAICAGPVSKIREVISDSGLVSGYSTHPTSNPANVSFRQWPPNIGIADGRTNVVSPITTPYNENAKFKFDISYGKGTYMFGVATNLTTALNPHGSRMFDAIDVKHQISGVYNVSVRIRYRVYDLLKLSAMRIIFGFTDDLYATLITQIVALYQTVISADQPVFNEVVVSCGQLTYEQLQNRTSSPWRFHCTFEMLGEGAKAGDPAEGTFICYEPEVYVSYSTVTTPTPIPQEKVRTFVSNLTCTVDSVFRKNITPPELIKELIQRYSTAKINTADFALEDTKYTNERYFLNGILPAGTKLKEAIKIILFEGLGRLKYNQGEIQFLSYFDDQDSAIDSVLTNDDVIFKSRNTEHYSTESIINNVEVSYGYDIALGEYQPPIEGSDADSISKFGRKDLERELTLVSDMAVAQTYAARILEVMKGSPEVFSFGTFLPKGYLLEKGDRVEVPSFLNKAHIVIGNILSITRTFGQGKNNVVNAFNVQLTQLEYALNLRLSEIVYIDDSFIQLPRVLRVVDGVVVDDRQLDWPRKVFLNLVEAIDIEDALFSFGTQKTLTLSTETVVFSDKDFTEVFCHGYGDCGYGVQPYGE